MVANERAIANLVGSGGLSFELRGQLVDANPDTAGVAPSWRNTLEPIRAWASQESGVDTVLTTFTTRGGMETYTRADDRRVDAVTDDVSAGNVEMVNLTIGMTPTRLRPSAHVVQTFNFATGSIRRNKGVNSVTRRRSMHLNVQRYDGPHTERDLELIVATTRAFAAYLPPAAGFASLEPPDNLMNFGAALDYHLAGAESDAALANQDQIFGYQWMQLFTPPVIGMLEAAGHHMADVPAELKIPIDAVDGTTSILVALRRSPYEVTDADMRAFRTFVLPVLYVTGEPRPGSLAAIRPDRTRPVGILPEDWYPEGTPAPPLTKWP